MLQNIFRFGLCLALGFILLSWHHHRIEKTLLSEVLEIDPTKHLITPAFPLDQWNKNQISLRPYRKKRGDYLVEARRPPFEPVTWTLNKYTKELIPWTDGKSPQKSPLN
jgi:hypothetical protein